MHESNAIKFWGAGTTRTFRPIWVAEELGVGYEHHAFGPRTGETQSEYYTRLNPKQKIPYLVDGGVRLSESVAISRYLIERYGSRDTMSAPDCLAAREGRRVGLLHLRRTRRDQPLRDASAR